MDKRGNGDDDTCESETTISTTCRSRESEAHASCTHEHSCSLVSTLTLYSQQTRLSAFSSASFFSSSVPSLVMAEIVERYSTVIGIDDIYSQRRAQPKLKTAYVCFKIILLVTNLVFMVSTQRSNEREKESCERALSQARVQSLTRCCFAVTADLRLHPYWCRFVCS